MEDILRRLEEHTEARRCQFGEGSAPFGERLAPFARLHNLADWEGWFSPYDDETYNAVLDHVAADDVVLEIGAGDLRLALRIAERAQRVHAVEVNPLVVGPALEMIGLRLPRNLHVTCANALDVPVPRGVSVAVLLMRHCRHFGQYFERLRTAGCRRLLTNARWKSGVEEIDLQAHRVAFSEVTEGWYACRCGAVGYVGQGEQPLSVAVEVAGCPVCASSWES
jgi:SAM-dependent methyltransferase